MSCWLGHGNGAEHTLEHTDIALFYVHYRVLQIHKQTMEKVEKPGIRNSVYMCFCVCL